MQHTRSEKIELCAPEHLAFDVFQTIDLTFRLSLRPVVLKRGSDRSVIALKCHCEVPQFRHSTSDCFGEPVIELIGKSFADDLPKALHHLCRHSEFRRAFVQISNEASLIGSQDFAVLL